MNQTRRDKDLLNWYSSDAIDTNVAPKHTLDTIEDIVTHSKVKFDGMIITLKLLDWKLAEQLAEMIGRVRSWGFSDVRCRQLSYNRQEVCIAAIKNRASRRLKKKPAKRNSKPRK